MDKRKKLTEDFGEIIVVNPLTGEIWSEEEYERIAKQKTKSVERFIAGPLPVSWWKQALTLNKSAISMAMALFFQAGLLKRRRFKLEPSLWRELGISESARKRGLRELASSGLVKIEPALGQAPVVEIVLNDSEPR